MGKKRMVKSLETRDLHVALSRRHAALAEFQRAFTAAQHQTSPSPIVEAAMAWREELVHNPDHADGASGAFIDEAERIEAEHGYPTARWFADIAQGAATPLLHYVDAWLAEGGPKGPLRERTKTQYRSDCEAILAWARAEKIPPTIEAFTRKVASHYVTGVLAPLNRGTANRKISAPSSYWRWLVKRGHAEANPWHNQSLSKVRIGATADDRRRAFTDTEVATLIAGDADQELADLMRVAALSGMRIDEPYRLRVTDCAGGWFDLRRAKTPAGRRRIPIHSALAEIVERRTKGKAKDVFLFPEPGPERPGRERSMAVSKRFGNYRQRLNIHEARDGVRQSRVVFNSFRSWFITKARAGFDRAVVAAVVGHEAGNITDDVYSAGPPEALRRACVESVRLP